MLIIHNCVKVSREIPVFSGQAVNIFGECQIRGILATDCSFELVGVLFYLAVDSINVDLRLVSSS